VEPRVGMGFRMHHPCTYEELLRHFGLGLGYTDYLGFDTILNYEGFRLTHSVPFFRLY